MERGEAGLHTQEQMLQLHSAVMSRLGPPITGASLFQTPIQNNGVTRRTAVMCVLFQSFVIYTAMFYFTAVLFRQHNIAPHLRITLVTKCA